MQTSISYFLLLSSVCVKNVEYVSERWFHFIMNNALMKEAGLEAFIGQLSEGLSSGDKIQSVYCSVKKTACCDFFKVTRPARGVFFLTRVWTASRCRRLNIWFMMSLYNGLIWLHR